MLGSTLVSLEIFLDILRALATCLFEVRGAQSLLILILCYLILFNLHSTLHDELQRRGSKD